MKDIKLKNIINEAKIEKKRELLKKFDIALEKIKLTIKKEFGV